MPIFGLFDGPFWFVGIILVDNFLLSRPSYYFWKQHLAPFVR